MKYCECEGEYVDDYKCNSSTPLCYAEQRAIARKEIIQKDEKNGMYQKAEEKPQCPFCDAKDSLTMKKETVSKPKASGLLTATFDVWECSACKESFFQHWNYNFIDTNNA